MIYLIRHAKTEVNDLKLFRSSYSEGILSEEVSNVSKVATFLKDKNINRIFCSTENRAIETASIIADFLRLKLEESEMLTERGYGKFDGMSFSQLKEEREKLNHNFLDPTQDWFGVESVESDREIYIRFTSFLDELSNIDGVNIAIVTHAGFIKSVLHQVLDIDFKSYCKFKIPNVSTTILSFDRNTPPRLMSLIPVEFL